MQTAEPDADPSEDVTLDLPWDSGAGSWTVEVGSPAETVSVCVEVGASLVLGSGRHADLRLVDRAVSACHCRIEGTPAGIRVQDLGSRNGLLIGSARVDSALLGATETALVLGRSSLVVRASRGDDSPGPDDTIPGLIGASAPMRRVARQLRRLATLRAPVLLQGASGTGKDVVARVLHTLSQRRGSYVALNVGAVPETLIDGELFGHRRGAFTGAVSSRAGAFEQADHGTLFLDEIAELPHSGQVKLLRVVEDGIVRPIGAVQPFKVEARLISATLEPLPQRVQLGQFREDLLHRLATFVIELPSLSRRKSDIPALSQFFLDQFSGELGPKRLTASALAKLVSYGWPGNVRELRSALYRAAAAAEGEEIHAPHIDVRPALLSQKQPGRIAQRDVLRILDRHSGNISAAARAAGVARSTFRSWVDRARSDR